MSDAQTPTAPFDEPETLGPADVLPMTRVAVHTERVLDPLFAALTAADAPTCLYLAQACEVLDNPTPNDAAIVSMAIVARDDGRFAVWSLPDGVEVVGLKENAPAATPAPECVTVAGTPGPSLAGVVMATPDDLAADEDIARIRRDRDAAELASLRTYKADLLHLLDTLKEATEAEEEAKAEYKAAKDLRETALEAVALRAADKPKATDADGSHQEVPGQQRLDLGAPAAEATKPMEEAAPNGGTSIEITDLDWAGVAISRLSRLDSTGKPATVRPIEHRAFPFPVILTDVQERVAIFHSVLTAKEFDELYPNGVRFALPSDMPDGEADLFGFPVRLGRAKRWLGKTADAWLITVPEDAAIGEEEVAALATEEAMDAEADEIADEMADADEG